MAFIIIKASLQQLEITMQQSQNKKCQILENIVNICRNATLKLTSYSFETICLMYKELSYKLAYLINLLDSNNMEFTILIKNIKITVTDCFQQVFKIVSSTEFQKYGHYFPLFQYLIQKAQRVLADKPSKIKTGQLLERIKTNEQSERYKFFRQSSTYNTNYASLSSSQYVAFFTDLKNDSIIFNNYQCVGCSRVFIKDFIISNCNPCFKVIKGLHFKKGFNKNYLRKNLCAVLNSGGGVVVIGTHRQENLKSKGIKFTSDIQIKQKEDLIYQVAQSLNPQCSVRVQRVLVHTNYLDHKNINQQLRRYCLRIIIFPKSFNRVHYIVDQSGYTKSFDVYRFQQEESGDIEKVLSDEVANVYSFIHEQYARNRSLKNCHQNVKCFHFYPKYSTIFYRFSQQNILTLAQNLSDSEYQSSQNEEQPKFKYELTSLLIVSSKNYCRQVKILDKFLKQSGQQIEISMPFYNNFSSNKKSVRYIWMISHSIDPAKLKHIIEVCEQKKKIKQSSIKLMPVHRALQLESIKLSQEKKKNLESKFQERYKKKIEMLKEQKKGKNNEIKTLIILLFDDYAQAIFAFKVLEQVGIRSYFIKEGTFYTKKQTNY